MKKIDDIDATYVINTPKMNSFNFFVTDVNPTAGNKFILFNLAYVSPVFTSSMKTSISEPHYRNFVKFFERISKQQHAVYQFELYYKAGAAGNIYMEVIHIIYTRNNLVISNFTTDSSYSFPIQSDEDQEHISAELRKILTAIDNILMPPPLSQPQLLQRTDSASVRFTLTKRARVDEPDE